mmetsp:Transcript_9989/g.17991  ORF Transcript_9989/g.17991 Transcript_9989/m.17991 type:complete len:88 (-) Transcript_9989:125-388(-)
MRHFSSIFERQQMSSNQLLSASLEMFRFHHSPLVFKLLLLTEKPITKKRVPAADRARFLDQISQPDSSCFPYQSITPSNHALFLVNP